MGKEDTIGTVQSWGNRLLGKCRWRGAEGHWSTSCGVYVDFPEESNDFPNHNEFEFCPFCGKRIEVIGGQK